MRQCNVGAELSALLRPLQQRSDCQGELVARLLRRPLREEQFREAAAPSRSRRHLRSPGAAIACATRRQMLEMCALM